MNSLTPNTRRNFLKQSALSAAAGGAAFSITGCFKPQPSSDIVLGHGNHQYEVIHDWAKLPDNYTWQTTHNVAVDGDNRLYVIHEGRVDQPDHPTIFVFDENGEFIKAFGSFQGGGHGIEVRREGHEEFLYVCAYQQLKTFAKMTLDGEIIWQRWAPMDAGGYHADEASNPQKVWGRDRFMPTNFAFLDDGGFFLADGYGSHRILRYDAEANFVSSFGSHGKEDGQFNLPHGVWIDDRGPEKTVAVCDRANNRMQWFTLGGEHIKTVSDGFTLPANVDLYRGTMLIPDLAQSITLQDPDGTLTHLGKDPKWEQTMKEVDEAHKEQKKKVRQLPETWQDGRFVHPHDACFDREGNIF
ncbi:MAG: twin-arginine translocation signal domain-containing protein, partial [Verrucomicrobiota bacterium]